MEKELYVSNTVGTDQTYKNKKVGLLFEGLKDVTVEGNNSLLNYHGKMTTITIIDSENITFENLSIDFEVPTVIDMYVDKIEGNTVTYKIPTENPYKVEGNSIRWESDSSPYTNSLYWSGTNGFNYSQIHDTNTGLTWRGANHIFNNINSISDLGNHVVKITYNSLGSNIKEGYSVQMRSTVRDHPGAFILNSKNTKLLNMNIHFLHGFGIVVQTSDGFVMDHVNFKAPEGSLRTTVGYADFLQVSGSKGEIKITNSYFENPHDDPINIHGTYLQVSKIYDDRKTIEVSYKHNETGGFPTFFEGDKVEFFTKSNMIGVENSVNKVVSVNGPDGKGGKGDLNDLNKIKLTLENEIPTSVTTDAYVVENITYTPSVYIADNYFTSVPTRGILVTTRKEVVIENNIFDGMGMASIYISSDAQSWYESGPAKDVTIKNNEFWGYNNRASSTPAALILVEPTNPTVSTDKTVHENFTIKDNKFYVMGGEVLNAKSVSGIDFEGNKVINYIAESNFKLIANTLQVRQGEELKLTPKVQTSTNRIFSFNGSKLIELKNNDYQSGINMKGNYYNQSASDIRQTGDGVVFNGGDNIKPAEYDVNYVISDESIVSLENDKLVAKKEGTTDIYAVLKLGDREIL